MQFLSYRKNKHVKGIFGLSVCNMSKGMRSEPSNGVRAQKVARYGPGSMKGSYL